MEVGVVLWDKAKQYAVLEFEPSFIRKAIDLAPITMPLSKLQQGNTIFSFPHLNDETFKKLPGLLADSLPDTFGNKLIDLWLAQNGKSSNDFTPVERLCYVGTRGMGALEFEPKIHTNTNNPEEIQLNELVAIAKEVMQQKESLSTSFETHKKEALQQIIQVGTSAGGMRPKAVIAVNPTTGKILSGYANTPKTYEHWILKFDGIQDTILGMPQGYGIIEYVYHLMALKAGIHMNPCKLLHEGGRAHFMTQRFDRVSGERIHMQTLTGIAHYDFNAIGSTSYEQLFQVMRKLHLGHDEIVQMYRRMIFNVVGRNQDDHTKNTAFLLPKKESWKLSPAYDITYSYNPQVGRNTNQHQMSINGKRVNITRDDCLVLAKQLRIKKPELIINEVVSALSQWPQLAKTYGLDTDKISKIHNNLFLTL